MTERSSSSSSSAAPSRTRSTNRITRSTTRSELGRTGIATRRPTTSGRASARSATRPAKLTRLDDAAAPGGRRSSATREARQGRGYLTSPDRSSRNGGRDADHGGSQTSLSLSLFVGGGGFGSGFAYRESDWAVGFGTSYGYGHGPWYRDSYLHAHSYSPFWHDHYFGGHAFHQSYWAGFGWHSRFHFGFSYYHPYSVFSPYPFYRRSYYEPYYLSAYSWDCPAYRTYYYVRRRPTTVYVEVADPYVEEEVVVDFADVYDEAGYDGGHAGASYAGAGYVEPAAATPSDPFAWPFVAGFPEGLDFGAYLTRGEASLHRGEYLDAAEAFRRAMLLRSDDYSTFQLAVALFAAERYLEAGQALERGLEQNPAWIHRRFDLSDSFSSRAEFDRCLNRLEGYLLEGDREAEASFVLGYAYYFSGNLFGARSVLTLLSESDARLSVVSHARAMAVEAEVRLTRR